CFWCRNEVPLLRVGRKSGCEITGPHLPPGVNKKFGLCRRSFPAALRRWKPGRAANPDKLSRRLIPWILSRSQRGTHDSARGGVLLNESTEQQLGFFCRTVVLQCQHGDIVGLRLGLGVERNLLLDPGDDFRQLPVPQRRNTNL